MGGTEAITHQEARALEPFPIGFETEHANLPWEAFCAL